MIDDKERTHENIRFERDGAIARVTMNRLKKQKPEWQGR